MNALSSSVGSEPESLLTCSKFHFEEKVLEKLVRLEHKIEIYEESAKRWDNSIVSKLEKMDEVLKRSKIFMESVQFAQKPEHLRLNESYSEIVDSLKRQLENETELYGEQIKNLLNSFSLKIHEFTEAEKKRENAPELMQLTFIQEQKRFNHSFDQMGENIKAISNRTIQEMVSGRKVAMTACVLNSGTKPSGSVVKFDDVLTQVGINNIASFRKSGQFTSEVKGLYLVSAWIYTTTNYGHFYIYKNQMIIGRIVFNYISTSATVETTGTAVVAVELQIGDTVRIQTGKSMTIISSKRSCFTIAKLN
ncbi:unnamed protein product [Mytilus coruscus]|uniref:C1q domain-containing protein n=1 Tax=Mytilus coruscus TaxID=42192 RepID=A0A6J8AP52_MYTCO|nr:unnamed protein product [Mytilus coruscus]